MLKTNDQNNKLLKHSKFSQVELTFNSNGDLNILLGENSKNIDKLNEILDVKLVSLEINYLLLVKIKI